MVFLFYNKWLLRLLVLLTGAGIALTAYSYVSLSAAKLQAQGARDALAVVSFFIAGWLAMLVAEVLDNHYARVLGCLCVGLGGFVSYKWIFVNDGPQLITLKGGAAAMGNANLGFMGAMACAALMLILLVTRLIMDKVNAGRLPTPAALQRYDKVLSSSAAGTAGAAAPATDGQLGGVPISGPPTGGGDALPPIPIDASPLSVVQAGSSPLQAPVAVATAAARTPAPVSRLTGIGGLYVGQAFALAPGEHSVGRSDAEILLADDVQVSRKHALISVDPGGMATLRDTGSTNGSFLNDARVTEAQLAPGDVLRFGTSLFKVEG